MTVWSESPARKVLDRLQEVRSIAQDRWTARCPAHEDRRPSLSIREVSDGRLLLYCFAGCGAVDILDAIGLEPSDLFPARQPKTYAASLDHQKPPSIPASDALSLLGHEALVLYLIACAIARGEPVALHAQDLVRTATRVREIHAGWMEQPR